MTELRFIQKYGDGCNVTMVSCDFCISRAVALFADQNNNALALCEKHRVSHKAPEPTPGIEYSPTGALMDRWHLQGGVPVYDARAVSRFQKK